MACWSLCLLCIGMSLFSLTQVQPVMSSNIKPHRNPGLRIVVGEPVNDISEAKLYHLLPYEAVENTNTPERQAYKFKVFYGSKFVPHKKKTALHRRTRNKTKLPSLKRMHSYQ